LITLKNKNPVNRFIGRRLITLINKDRQGYFN
jgi:hypothetical protein